MRGQYASMSLHAQRLTSSRPRPPEYLIARSHKRAMTIIEAAA